MLIAAVPSYYFSIFANFVYCGSHTRFTVPIGPFLCLAMMTSADSLHIGIMVVIIITVDEHYHVGILLDGSGLTQIGKHRAVIRPLLHGSRELGQGNYRHVKLSGECLEGSGNIRNLLLTGVCSTSREPDMSCR